MNPTVSSNSTEAKQLERQGIEQILPPKQTRRPLPCLLIPSFFYDCILSLQLSQPFMRLCKGIGPTLECTVTVLWLSTAQYSTFNYLSRVQQHSLETIGAAWLERWYGNHVESDVTTTEASLFGDLIVPT